MYNKFRKNSNSTNNLKIKFNAENLWHNLRLYFGQKSCLRSEFDNELESTCESMRLKKFKPQNDYNFK